MTRSQLHYCLVSEQPTPTIAPVMDSKFSPTELRLVVTPQQKERADRLEQILKPRGIVISRLECPHAWNFPDTESLLDTDLQAQRSNHQGWDIFANVTGGTKPMSIAAYSVFYTSDLPVYYVQNDAVHWLHAPNGQRDFGLDHRIKLKDFLWAHGVQIVSSTPPPGADERLQLARWLAPKVDTYSSAIRALNWLAQQAFKSQHLTVSLETSQANDPALESLLYELEQKDILTLAGNTLRFSNEQDRFFCNGGWLELWTLSEVNKLRNANCGFQECAGSVEVLSGRSLQSQNEIDVALLANNRLTLIECKTRTMSRPDQDADINTMVYKLAALSRQLGGIMAKGVVVSAHPVKPHFITRARDAFGIEICAHRQLSDLNAMLQAGGSKV